MPLKIKIFFYTSNLSKMFIDILILYYINLLNNIFMNFLKNKTILITGGTGSFGSNFTKYLFRFFLELTRILAPEYFRPKFKWIRFSKETMLLFFGTK